MQLLKQSTASSIIVGPVLDSTGAAYTGAVIGDFTLSKNGTSATMAAAATATHEANGMYVIAMITGNTDTLGRVDIYCNKATYAMGLARFEVLTGATFDAIVTVSQPVTSMPRGERFARLIALPVTVPRKH